MTLVTISKSDIGTTQSVLKGVEKALFTKTSESNIRISNSQSTSSKAVYAFNPILETFVEIDPSQAWFWKPEWLAGELKAENELRAGEFEEFDNIDDFIDSL